MTEVGRYTKPLPIPDEDTAEFWAGCKARELRAQRCTACGAYRWPPQAICSECYSWDFGWVKLAETGQVTSFVIVHHDPMAFPDEVPYVMANITIDGTDERVRMRSRLEGVTADTVSVGMPVRVRFEDVTDAITLAKFTPEPC
jgi:uncharacterized OB-fold protein